MNRTLNILIGLSLFGAAACHADEVFPVVHNEPLSVRVVSGKDGRPQARVRLALAAGYDQRDLAVEMWREEVVTDGAGVAQLSNALRNLPLLRVRVLNRHSCAPGAEKVLLNVEQIRGSGLSRENRCGTAVVENAPGMLTVYVKGDKDGSQAGSIAALPAVVHNPPIPAAGSEARPRAGDAARSANDRGLPADDDFDEAIAPAPATPAPGAHTPGTHADLAAKAAAPEQANASLDDQGEAPPTESAAQTSIAPLGLDAPPVAGPAPRTGQSTPRADVRATSAKPASESSRTGTPDQGHRPTVSPKMTRDEVPSSGSPPAGGAVSVERTVAFAKPAAGHVAGPVKPSPVNADRPLVISTPAAPAPGGGQVSAASANLAKPRSGLAADPALATIPASAVHRKRASVAGLDRVSAHSAVRAHRAALDAVQAAIAAASGVPAQTRTALPLQDGPNASSAPSFAPAQTPAQSIAATPGEEDADWMCGPG